MIQKTRIHLLNSNQLQNKSYVLYWMQQSQRVDYNHALEYAVIESNRVNLPLIVLFCLTPDFPDANYRHYEFMAQGLIEVKKSLHERGINMFMVNGDPVKEVVLVALNAALLITDRGYLRLQRQWRMNVAAAVKCAMIEIESECIVPVETVSSKEEYTAGTLRPKIQRLLREYLVPLKHNSVKRDSLTAKCDAALFPASTKEIIRLVKPNMTVPAVKWLSGGYIAASERLSSFINHKLDKFGSLRNDPSMDYSSGLSSYIHFGQISTLQIALEVNKTHSPGKDVFLEELIVRRELAYNFVWYNKNYDSYKSLPSWAANTLETHRTDTRKPWYSETQLEKASTYDPYWNAAQREMHIRGKMHGYMRMYWGKKLIEWMSSPADAYAFALYLNNKYELDGRDPNGFAGVAWCFGKHDRAWKERPVFGKVRYMNASGLERKFDIDAYVSKIEAL
ncbi:MAG: deoxyribodipyrimidine photo-lyase [Chitinispirillaceae bacterium]|nr:deoxyribodipyrimidine photo-lyase [Chitinispirillaceae bacterium]